MPSTLVLLGAAGNVADIMGACRDFLAGRSGKASEQAIVRYWGVVLFEWKRNLRNLSAMVKSEGTEGYAIVGTTLKGAVWDLLCRTTPHVGLLEVVEEA